ncbi:MAG: F0F1 ATP synthase subunit delta [Bacteroidetes bacterium]|nr:F0F1 ATP synthase subunit delta [Bacteroidota bacterium]
MAETKVARRYAKSLLDLGKEQNITEQLYQDMLLVANTIRDNRQLSVLFKSPIVNTDKKGCYSERTFRIEDQYRLSIIWKILQNHLSIYTKYSNTFSLPM